MDEKFDPELNSEKLLQQRVTTFKKAISDMIATSKSAYVRSDSKSPRERHRLYTKEEIHRIVERGDAIERAALSEHFFAVSGLYKRIILHYATFLTYSWLLVPQVKNRKDKLKATSLDTIESTYIHHIKDKPIGNLQFSRVTA